MSQFCATVTQEKIRARIDIGGVSIRTPYVKAFNVDKNRTNLINTFSATIEIYAGVRLYVGSDIEIYHSVNGNEKKIFTGEIRTITTQPSFDKAGYFILNMSGVDKMGVLEGRTFSRRLRSDGFSLFVSIDGGPVNRATKGISTDKTIKNGTHQIASKSPKITSTEGPTEAGKVIYMPKRGSKSGGGPYAKADSLSGRGPDSGSGTSGVHDHTTLQKGGPAFGVYAVS